MKKIILLFMIINISIFSSYKIENNKVYYEKENRGYILIKGAESKSFEILSEFKHAAKDKNTAYYGENKLENSDPETFEYVGLFYTKDKNVVYCDHIRLEGSDPETFELSDYVYAKDKNSVYYIDEKLDGSDPKTFQYLGEFTGKDKNKVYVDGIEIKGADSKTYEILDYFFHYSIDKNSVYYYGKKIKGANPLSFKVMTNLYEECKDGEYLCSISTSYEYDSEDKNNYYREGKIVKKK